MGLRTSRKVSVIIPTHNVRPYITQTLEAIRKQQQVQNVEIEISIHDDGSIDGTYDICKAYLESNCKQEEYILSRSDVSRGPGIARNIAVRQSSGEFLCFNDADDVSLPNRVQAQMDIWFEYSVDEILIGSRFVRDPPDATRHYAAFLNELSDEDLHLKAFRELTLIQPTWFLSRKLFDSVSGYREGIIAEDLELFHRILDIPSIRLVCCPQVLVIYRHLSGSVSSKTSRLELVKVRVDAFQRRILTRPNWISFSVWGAGRDGRAFFEALNPENRKRIREFVDIDENKIKSSFHHSGIIIPVRHISQVQKPFIVCVAMGRTGGELEANIKATNALEGIDYWHFN